MRVELKDHDLPRRNIYRDLTGIKFGELTVIKPVGHDGAGCVVWLCRCSCGNEELLSSRHILNRKKVLHCSNPIRTNYYRKMKERLYRIWCAVKSRCYNKSHTSYQNYGERGITVCDEWLNSFDLFKAWALENGYSDDLSIDRVDGSKGYSLENCRWATSEEQASNRRSNKHFTDSSGIMMNQKQWAEQIGISENALIARMNK